MAPASNSNWLSFSLSPMEMLRSSDSQFVPYHDQTSPPPSTHYFFDNFYSNGWSNPKSQVLYSEVEQDSQSKDQQTQNMTNSSIFSSYMDVQTQHHSVPKLEDFLGDSSSLVRYSDSQTETQDSSLTQLYGHGSAYFNDQQDLKAITAFQAFSNNFRS